MSRFYFIPEDWEMSDKLLKWTKDEGLTDEQIKDQLEKIRDHQYKTPRIRPDACWRNWVRNAIKWGEVVPVQETRYRGPQEVSEDQLEQDRKDWQRDMKERFGK